MVLTFEQERDLQVLKHEHKIEVLGIIDLFAEEDHNRRMKELDRQFEIAVAQAKSTGGAK